MSQTEAPILLVVRKEGGWFSGEDETVTVNYRVHGDRYIVDSVFNKALLIAGTGQSQERVTITKEK
jgi:type IV secretion system protein VirB9